MECNTSSQFRATKKMLLSSTFSKTQFPMDYATWNALDTDYKAVALFVNYYRTITVAWSQFINPVITTDDAVAAVLDKLHKIVPIMSEYTGNGTGEEIYTSGYIYTVCWRAIMDKSKGKGVNERYHKEVSNEVSDWDLDDVIDLFDIVAYENEPMEVVHAREALWTIIEGMGPKALKVADHLINGSSLHKSHKGDGDLLADVSVSADEYTNIVKELKKQIAPLGYAWGY